MHVTKCGVRVCHHHTGLLCTGLYTQQFKCVHKCIRLCEPAWVHVHVMLELKIVNKRPMSLGCHYAPLQMTTNGVHGGIGNMSWGVVI